MHMNTELIMTCLMIMLKGMVGIFTVILAIWGLVALLNRLTAPKQQPEKDGSQ